MHTSSGELDRNPKSHAPNRFSAAVDSCSGKFGVGIIALTNLQELQDQLGENSQDTITEVFRQRASSILRPSDEIIVIAADSLCIVLDELIDENHLQLAGLKLERIFEQPFEAESQIIDMKVRSGLVYVGRRTRLSKTAGELYQSAEDTCLNAVFTNVSFDLVTASMDAPLDHHWHLNQRVRAAMDNHDITFDYQPKVWLKDGELAGGEALIRWRDNGLIIPPDEYIEALNDDLLWELTIYGYRRILREILEYKITVPVAFNIDPSSLTQPDFLDFLKREASLWGVPPAQIVFEITESKELFDLNASKSLLDKIRAAGFRISLDDFGTEHSNMLRVRELPLDEIKIDRTLCGTILENEDSHQITLSVIGLAKALGVPTVAEGIEDAETLELLRGMDCQIGQGFHLGRPMSIEKFAKLQPDADTPAVSSDEQN